MKNQLRERTEKTKIVYVIGTGHSGSTLLDIVLGNSQKIRSTGELHNVIGGWLRKKTCSCSEEIHNCTFWGKVKKLFEEKSGELDLRDILGIQRRFERDILSLPRLVFNNIYPSRLFKQYEELLKGFYTSISVANERTVFVDSSKNPLRAYTLLNIFKEDIYFIHLVRDGRATLRSWMRIGKIPPFDIPITKTNGRGKKAEKENYWWTAWVLAISWVLYNLLSSFVTQKAGSGKSIRISYEDLMRDPSYYIKRISELVDEDLSDLDQMLLRKESLRVDHVITGNKIRRSNEIILRLPDEEWKSELHTKHKIIFWLVAGWLARLYGYKFS